MAKSWGMLGQTKMSCAATGKGNKSRVNPELWWENKIKCQNWVIILIGSMVVLAASSHLGIPGSISQRSQISSLLLP